jgi:hypothetical protein
MAKISVRVTLEHLNLAFWIILTLGFIFFVNHQVISQVNFKRSVGLLHWPLRIKNSDKNHQ